MYIKPEHRGRGLLEALIQAVKESARQNKALDLRLYVHKKNARAIRAYRKSGFIDADYQIMRWMAANTPPALGKTKAAT